MIQFNPHFQDCINFQNSGQRNELIMIFSAKLSVEDVIKILKSISVMKSATETIRNALQQVDFGLQDRFCDAEEL